MEQTRPTVAVRQKKNEESGSDTRSTTPSIKQAHTPKTSTRPNKLGQGALSSKGDRQTNGNLQSKGRIRGRRANDFFNFFIFYLFRQETSDQRQAPSQNTTTTHGNNADNNNTTTRQHAIQKNNNQKTISIQWYDNSHFFIFFTDSSVSCKGVLRTGFTG